jgi:hypothetical protein
LNGLYLLYTSQNLLGTIFRVTFTVFYTRIWNIVGKYSILCCDIVDICSYRSWLPLIGVAVVVKLFNTVVLVLYYF